MRTLTVVAMQSTAALDAPSSRQPLRSIASAVRWLRHPLLLISIALPSLSYGQSSVQDFHLSGSASIISRDCIRLTPDRPYRSGSAWFKTAFDLGRPFEMKLSIVLGEKDLDGADGIVFVFHPTIQTGARGEGMGFAGLIPSLGIEFDTYQNRHLNEPPSDHMAFMRNGQTFHFDGRNGVVELKNLEDGARHPLRIVWRPKAGQLQVYLDHRLIA
ncbi:MAG: L-type lectin-domain containing protein, partial [Myxococcota bacterium]